MFIAASKPEALNGVVSGERRPRGVHRERVSVPRGMARAADRRLSVSIDDTGGLALTGSQMVDNGNGTKVQVLERQKRKKRLHLTAGVELKVATCAALASPLRLSNRVPQCCAS